MIRKRAELFFTLLIGFISCVFHTASAQHYGTYAGGSNTEFTDDILVDLNLNVYLLGTTMSVSGIATPAAYDTSHNGSYDVFLSKYRPDGTLEWSTYYGGSNVDRARKMIFDLDSNLVVVGSTQSASGIATPGSLNPTRAGTDDGFLCKWNRAGNLLYGTYIGGDSLDNIECVKLAPNGDYILCGSTYSVNFLNFTGIQQAVNAGKQDVLLARMNPAGIILWQTYFGGTDNESGRTLLIDEDDHIYLFFTSYSLGLATSGAPKTSHSGVIDVVMARFTSQGLREYATYFGGEANDNVNNACWDNNHQIVIVGQTTSVSGISTGSAYQTTIQGTYDGFICKTDTAFQTQWSTYVGGPQLEVITGVCTDKKNNIYIWADGNSATNIATTGAWQETYGGPIYDCFLQMYDVSGSRLWGTYLGGSSTETSANILYGPDKNLYMNGITSSSNNIVTPGAYQSTLGGGNDAFYFKYVLPINADTCDAYFKNGFTVNKQIQCTRDNEFVFTDTTTFNGTITHYWDFGNGNFGSNTTETVHYDPIVNNQITVKLISTLNGSCSDSSVQTVYLISSPETAVITGNTPVYMGSRQTYSVPFHNGSTYQWFFESGTGSSFNSSIQIKWLIPDTVMLKVLETNGGGCVGDTAYLEVIIKDPTGLETEAENNWSVYPNPATDILHISGKNNALLQVDIYDLEGRFIASRHTDSDGNFNVSAISNGLYLLLLGQENMQRKTIFVVIQ